MFNIMNYLNIVILLISIAFLVSAISGIQSIEYNNGKTTIEYFSGYGRILPIFLAIIFGSLFYLIQKKIKFGYIAGWIVLVGFYICSLILGIGYSIAESGPIKLILIIFSIIAITLLFLYWAKFWKRQKGYFNIN